jgi:hypothetical protein
MAVTLKGPLDTPIATLSEREIKVARARLAAQNAMSVSRVGYRGNSLFVGISDHTGSR